MATKSALLSKVGEISTTSGNKITVVGCGAVGMAIAVAFLAQDVTTEVALVDVAEDRLIGEQLDLQHGSLYMNNAKITASTDYSVSTGSKICVIAAGVRKQQGDSNISLLERNLEQFKKIVPNLAEESPDAIIIVVSDPVDILTYATWKLSKFPKNRVIGCGTIIDSSRFRYFISKRLDVSPSAIEGWIIGEHGEQCIPVWSGVNVAGVRLRDINNNIGSPNDAEKWSDVYKHVITSSNDLIKLKGYANWGCAFCIAPVCNAILKNSSSLFPLSTCVNGEHGVERDVFLSLPCIIGADGVTHIVKQTLTDEERGKFVQSANNMSSIIDKLQFPETL